jgi:uncharacterized cofD-like protein
MGKPRKKIVCIGGGTGVPLVMRGLRNYKDLTAIITMFDSGGHSGKLRKELHILPMGDIRQCLINSSSPIGIDITGTFNIRFPRGIYKGDNLGNLYLAAAIEKTRSLEKAIDEVRRILGVEPQIYPVTLEKADIKVILKNNKRIKGEEEIVNCHYLSKVGIKKLYLDPSVNANPRAIAAIENADLIIIGPGKFYTSIISNFLVEGITEAINKSRAKKIFICNLMTQPGNTDNFTVEDFVANIEKYLGGEVNYVVFNTKKLPNKTTRELKKIDYNSRLVKYDPRLLSQKKFIGVDVLDLNIHQSHPSDVLARGANQRTRILHDPDKLAKIILNF